MKVFIETDKPSDGVIMPTLDGPFKDVKQIYLPTEKEIYEKINSIQENEGIIEAVGADMLWHWLKDKINKQI